MALSALSLDDALWSDDLRIAKRSRDTFGDLVDEASKVVQWNDGRLNCAEPRTLRSTAIDFEAEGVRAGRLLRLTAPPTTVAQKLLGPSGEPGVVATVSGRSLTMVRVRATGETAPGQAWAVPTPDANGVIQTQFSSITFTIGTLDPLTETVTAEVKDELRALGQSDATLAARMTDTLARKTVELRVLAQANAARSEAAGDRFAVRAEQFGREADRAWTNLARQALGLAPLLPDGTEAPVSSARAGGLTVGRLADPCPPTWTPPADCPSASPYPPPWPWPWPSP